MTVPGLIHQKSYENVVHVLRRHPVTFVPKIIFFLILLAAPPTLFFPLQATFPLLLDSPVALPLLTLGASAYLISILLFFYTAFTTFYLDVAIVTNDRIVDIEQFGLFSRTTAELDLYHIQDVTSEVHGVFPSFFDYGTITITTASNSAHLVFHDVRRPNTIRNDIIRLSEEDRKYHHS